MYKKPDEKFSDDPKENLHIENEILKLKMQAETNAFIVTDKNLPPDIEHLFLQNVQQWEDAYMNCSRIKVYDLIKRPEYAMEATLDDEGIARALERITAIMKLCDVCLHVDGQYDPRVIYRFITEELFEYETDDLQMPGMTQNFTYEEFHPNHQLDIHRRTMDFFEDWFERKFDEHSWELNDFIILPDASSLSKQEVVNRIHQVFASYTSFNNIQFAIGEISFQFDEDQGTGLGHAEGGVKYNAIMENGEMVYIDGSFKLYMSYESSWWNIFYFIFPSFVW